jgi:hypothetical protein
MDINNESLALEGFIVYSGKYQQLFFNQEPGSGFAAVLVVCIQDDVSVTVNARYQVRKSVRVFVLGF